MICPTSRRGLTALAGLVVLLAVGGCASASKRAGPLTDAALRDEIERKFPTIETPGAVFAVYRGNTTASSPPPLMLTLGYADEQRKRSISVDDHFRIASVNKTFVGAVVLQLLDEGRLGLDDPVSKYVSGVPAGDRITLRMLGHHTSGLPTAIANSDFRPPSPPTRAGRGRRRKRCGTPSRSRPSTHPARSGTTPTPTPRCWAK